MVKDNLDILMVLETKLDSSFPPTQFRIEGYDHPFRYDRKSHGGGILLFIKEDILAKILQSYNTHKNILGKILHTQLNIYENFLIVGDFNSEMTESEKQSSGGVL